MDWFTDAFVYQIYPLGLVGAPPENDFVQKHRILQLEDNGWIEHLRRLGATCVILNPIFQSSSHGYDTVDFAAVDARLGSNDDMRQVVNAFHEAGIRVLLDTVMNHVGRDFWAFSDVRANRQASAYANWFNIDWEADDRFADGFSYECWEGVDGLVKLNHSDFALNDYCIEAIHSWEREYDIDGLRLDVAYCLDRGFLGYLRRTCDELTEKRGQKFLMLGETMFGDYNLWMGDGACDTVTNYECYKGLWSSMNECNMHEIAYALNRQSGNDPWCLYTGSPLLNFVDNHDVARIATQLNDPRQLKALYSLLFGMPGVPCVYYGSEWGIRGEKLPGDRELRPAVNQPEWNDLTDWIAALARARGESTAIRQGSYREIAVQPHWLAFERKSHDDRVIVAINAASRSLEVPRDACGLAGTDVKDLISGQRTAHAQPLEIEPFGSRFWMAS